MPMTPISGPVDLTSSSQAKITLFRSLFRGRDDVYPRRFESRKTGKSGYAPACSNDGCAASAKNRASSAPPVLIASSFQ